MKIMFLIYLWFNINNFINKSYFFYEYFDLKKVFLICLTILFCNNDIWVCANPSLNFKSVNLNLYGMWPDSLAALHF